MKKLLLMAATVAIVLSSCSNNEEVNKTPGNGDEIGFRTIIDKGSETRAAITTTSNIRNFTVTGWWDNPDNGLGGLAELNDVQPSAYLFNGADISRREEAISDWEYAPKKYWPASGSVYFFAYSPAASKNIAPNKGIANYISPTSNVAAKTLLTYTVPNPSDDDGQEDFLLAYTGGIYNTTVGLHFVHALSRVRFAARKTNEHITYNIKQIRLLQLYRGANINLEEIPTNGVLDYTTPPLVVWDNHATLGSKEDITIDAGETPAYVEYSSTHYSSLQGLAAAMMVMPQKTELGADKGVGQTSGDGKFYIEVTYEAFIPGALPDGGDLYYTGDGTGTGNNRFDTRLFAVKDPVVTTNPLTFEMGRQYNFLLTFGDDAGAQLDFAVTVSNWNDDAPVVELPQIDDYTPFLSAKIANIIKDRTGNSKVSLNDIFKTTELKIDNAVQDDLLGLELFSQLKSLALDNTAAGLELDLKGLDNLYDLSLHRGANLGKLDISNVKKFMYINCRWDKIANPDVGVADNYITIGEMIVWDGFQYTSDTDTGKKIHISAHSSGTNQHAGVKIPSVKQVSGSAATPDKIWLGYTVGGTTGYDRSHYVYK